MQIIFLRWSNSRGSSGSNGLASLELRCYDSIIVFQLDGVTKRWKMEEEWKVTLEFLTGLFNPLTSEFKCLQSFNYCSSSTVDTINVTPANSEVAAMCLYAELYSEILTQLMLLT